MKNIILPHNRADSYEMLQGLWANRFFRESPYVQAIVAKAARRMPLLFEMTHPDIEWSHFTSYLCCLALRQYDNLAVQDLYYLHELIHIGEMPHELGIDFYGWRKAVFRNELDASMNSEVYAYFELPELRKASFDHEIWADRFLAPRWQQFYSSNRRDAQERLRRQRKLVSTNPNPHDYVEQQIAGYFHQNIQWAEIWRGMRLDVAQHMNSYVNGKTGPAQHRDWLESHYSSLPVPYTLEAELFAEQYRHNKTIFGNQRLQSETLEVRY